MSRKHLFPDIGRPWYGPCVYCGMSSLSPGRDKLCQERPQTEPVSTAYTLPEPSDAAVTITEAMVKAREALLLAADLLRDAIFSEDGLDAADAVYGVDTALDAVRLLEGVGAVDPHAALTAASERREEGESDA